VSSAVPGNRWTIRGVKLRDDYALAVTRLAAGAHSHEPRENERARRWRPAAACAWKTHKRMPENESLSDKSRSALEAVEKRLQALEKRTNTIDIKRVANAWAQDWREEVTELRLEAASLDDELAAARMNARAKALEECADVVQDLA